jgi:uncharacterized membrane-anchored protein
VTDRSLATRLTLRGALRVPEVTVYFWLIKALSTAMGEAASDYLVHAFPPVLAVLMGFAGFCVLIGLQFRARRYNAWTYWGAVVGVGVFGTMCADVLHVALGVPYIASSTLYAIALVAVFVSWQKTERTLSIHSIDTTRRELFYWAAVVATFAMGTALGDLTAFTLHLGFFTSAWLYAVFIAVPAVGYRWLGWNPILTFWWAYVATRPLGASFADGFGKPASLGGMGFGDGTVALILTVVILVLVAYLAVTHRDVQAAGHRGAVPERNGYSPARAQHGRHSGAHARGTQPPAPQGRGPEGRGRQGRGRQGPVPQRQFEAAYPEPAYPASWHADPRGAVYPRRHADQRAAAEPSTYRAEPAGEDAGLDWFGAFAERQRNDDPWRRR